MQNDERSTIKYSIKYVYHGKNEQIFQKIKKILVYFYKLVYNSITKTI